MPAIYVGGKFTASVTLEDKDYPYKQWTDAKLAKQREEYKKPNITLWLQIENKDDPISPLAIPVTNLDVYEGSLKTSQNGLTFTIEFDGKAKPTVHKDTKTAVDAGQTAMATSIAINGTQHSFETPLKIELTVQSKKL